MLRGGSCFLVHEGKSRLISAAPFRDRVVHHALCRVIEPICDRLFISDSYANRRGKGTHRALERFQYFSRRYPYVLRLDIVKHFQSMDHGILKAFFARTLHDERTLRLIHIILAGGELRDESDYRPDLFPGDDLLDLCRPVGLPIGNLTSQFWSNCYLHPLDRFVKGELGCRAYLRYVDDFALFGHHKRELYRWKQAIIERLAALRLRIHEGPAQVVPTRAGVPWLGFVVYPDHRRLKARKAVHATRRLRAKYRAWLNGEIAFAAFDAAVQGWINHAGHGDTWGLRGHVLADFELSARWRTGEDAGQ